MCDLSTITNHRIFKYIITCFSSVLLFSISLFGQTSFSLKGRVISGDGTPLEFASVIALNYQTGIRKGTDCDSLGKFEIKLPKGDYYIEASLVGYEKQASRIELSTDTNFGDIILKPLPEILKAAVITSSSVEHNVTGYSLKIKENKTFSALTLPEILLITPGTLSTPNDLMVYGRHAAVYIDKRRVKLFGSELIDYLRTLNGSNIKSIEVISSPGVEYRGEAAIIKITTDIEEGGALSVSGRVMFNGAKTVLNPTLNLTYKRGKFSTSFRGFYQSLSMRDSIINENINKTTGSGTLQPTWSNKWVETLSGTIGLGYEISKNDFISLEISDKIFKIKSFQVMDYTKTGSNSPYMEYLSNRLENNNFDISAIYSHTFKNKSTLETTLDYIYKIDNGILTDSIPSIYTINKNKKESNTSDLNSYGLNILYKSSLFNKKDEFKVGLNHNMLTNKITKGALFSFDYNEQLASVYTDYTYSFQKVGMRTSLKGEYSNINDNAYFNLCPNLLLTLFLNKSKGNIMRLNYTASISRPQTLQLSPSPLPRDNYIDIGDPYLLPSYQHSVNSLFILKNNYSLSANYIRGNNPITSLVSLGDDGLFYNRWINADHSNSLNINLQATFTPFEWWMLNSSIGYTYYEIVNKNTKRDNNVLNFFIVSSVTLPKEMSLSINVLWSSTAIKGINIVENSPLFANISFDKMFFKKKLRLSLSINDILDSNRSREVKIDMGDYIKSTKYHYSSRSFQISLSYNFSWGKRAMAKRHISGGNEIKGRITNY